MLANPPSSKLPVANAMRLVLCAMLCCTGCASLTGESSKGKKKKDSSWSWFSKKEYQVPQSMNVTWTHDIFTGEGKLPTRGFGGRIYFYNEKSQAIPVEGELTVYGFDDTHRDHSGMSVESADKRFRFTPEQFTKHFSEGQLGASYSVWIPWDVAPGEPKKIMLIPTFKTTDGRLVKGKPASLVLPGPAGSSESDPSNEVIQVSAKGPASGSRGSKSAQAPNRNEPNSGAPRTTTIQMPNRPQVRPQVPPEQAAALLQHAIEANRAQQENFNAIQRAAWEASLAPKAESGKVEPANAVLPVQSSVPPAGVATQALGSNDPNGVQVIDATPNHSPGWSVKNSTGAAINLSGSLPVRQNAGGLMGPRPFRFTQPSAAVHTEHQSDASGSAIATSDAPTNLAVPHVSGPAGSATPRFAPQYSPTTRLGQ